MIIYKITNLVNKKIYVGITTTSIGRRISSYKSTVKSNKESPQRIINAMRKYGFNNFKFEILETVFSREELKKKEIEYINFYKSTDVNTGYNISLGGDLISEETRQKMSNTRKGKPKNKEWKEKLSTSLKGHAVSEETRQKISQTLKGRYTAWNIGTKGIMKPNSGSFKKGHPSTNKGKPGTVTGRKKVIIDGKFRFVKPEII